jgi:hypothetical protein
MEKEDVWEVQQLYHKKMFRFCHRQLAVRGPPSPEELAQCITKLTALAERAEFGGLR